MTSSLRALGVVLVSLLLLTGCVDWVERRLHGVERGVQLEGYDLSGLYRHEVEGIVRQLALERNRPPQNATIDRRTGRPISEKMGVEVLVQETVEELLKQPEGGQGRLVTRLIPPPWTRADLEDLQVIAEFDTPITGKWERGVNVRVAAKAIDRFLLYPGEEFSFNRVVGPRTTEQGYIGAPEISGDHHIMGVGGGICQVSTTLFNAVEKMGLTVTERHKHSAPVEYIQWGRDASVYWGVLDFRFVNDGDHPLLIQTEIRKNRLYVRLLSRKGKG